jgi:hypothetical protein
MIEPRMRAGDADRERVVTQLGKHFADGRLDVGEFDERVARATAAVHLDEFPPLLADLPAEQAPARRPRTTADRTARAALAVLLAMLLAVSMVAVVHGAPPVFAVLLLVVLLRHRRWSPRW